MSFRQFNVLQDNAFCTRLASLSATYNQAKPHFVVLVAKMWLEAWWIRLLRLGHSR
jgi:hypothetical protein